VISVVEAEPYPFGAGAVSYWGWSRILLGLEPYPFGAGAVALCGSGGSSSELDVQQGHTLYKFLTFPIHINSTVLSIMQNNNKNSPNPNANICSFFKINVYK
jgi:hypothetical protein